MTTPEQQALQLAAQAWCTPATSGLEMDVNLATAVAEKFAPIIAENAALKAELERERMRLVACGVVALADTPESAATARKMHPDYESASCADVAWRVDECIRLRAELEAIQQGAGEPVAWANSSALESAKLGRERYGNQGATELHTWSEGGPSDCHDTPLYTRPCVPLTDEPELLEALKRLSFAAQTTGGVAGRDEGLCAAIDAAAAVIAKVVAHTKGAKP